MSSRPFLISSAGVLNITTQARPSSFPTSILLLKRVTLCEWIKFLSSSQTHWNTNLLQFFNLNVLTSLVYILKYDSV